jgi:PAS domain S-box-containing protein
MDESTTALRIIASSPVAVVFADRDGVIRIWNEAASKLLGYAPEQAIGRAVPSMLSLRGTHPGGPPA